MSWIFYKFLTLTLHTFVVTQMCPISFPNVEPSVIWSTEMTANPNQHWGAENHTSVSRFVTGIVEHFAKYWKHCDRAIIFSILFDNNNNNND